MNADSTQLIRSALASHPEHRQALGRARVGFTLIELLVVISIIGILATLGLTVGGAANRRAKEARVSGELRQLETAIESYRSSVGSLPNDNPGYPSTNQLYYELTGTLYKDGKFSGLNGETPLTETQVREIFHTQGFANSGRVKEEVRFKMDVKDGQYKSLAVATFGVEVKVLAVPVPGPAQYIPYPSRSTALENLTFAQKGFESATNPDLRINPWLYDASQSFRNNKGPGGYDLWAVTQLGNKTIQFSNWERKPVTLKTK